MTRKIHLTRFMSGLAVFGGLMAASCADSNYNLSDLNKTIAIGNDEGFTLVGNNTTTYMQLKDFLDELIDTTGVIKINSVTGDYYFTRGSEDGDINDAWPTVDEVEMTIKTETETSFDYDLSGMVDDAPESPQHIRKVAPDFDTPNDPKEVFHFEFNSIEQIAEVLHVSLAELRAGIDVILTPSDELRPLWENIEQIALRLPKYLELEFSKDGNPLKSESESEKNVLKLRKNEGMLSSEGIVIHVKLNGVDFDYQEPDSEESNSEESEEKYGWKLEYINDDTSYIVGGVVMDVWYTPVAASGPQTARAKAPEEGGGLFLNCTSIIEDKITLTSATGYFAPEIDLKKGKGEDEPVGKFAINRSELPDFMLDKEVRLNVHNPEIRVKIGSNLSMKGYITKAVMTAQIPESYGVNNPRVEIETFDENNTPILNIDKHEGDLNDATESVLILCDELPSADKRNKDAEKHIYYSRPAIDPKTGKRTKLSELLNIIPESIAFDCQVEADSQEEAYVKMGLNPETNQPWYHIQPSYEVYAPLAFDEGSVIVYNDTINGWHEDLDKITLSNNAEIEFNADVISNLPLDLEFHTFAIDNLGNELDDKIIKVDVTDANGNEVIIKSHETTRIKITLKQSSTDAFKVIDGLRFVATAFVGEGSAMEGVTLNQGQTLKIDNIGIRLKGRVVFDLN